MSKILNLSIFSRYFQMCKREQKGEYFPLTLKNAGPLTCSTVGDVNIVLVCLGKNFF